MSDELTNCKAEADRLKTELDRVTRLYQILLDKSDKQLDYIRELQTDNERLKKERSGMEKSWADMYVKESQSRYSFDQELERSAFLWKKVERLTKAGDAMAEWMLDSDTSVKTWNAAKEGKDL